MTKNSFVAEVTLKAGLNNLYSDFLLCTASDTFRILTYSELCLFRYMQPHPTIYNIIKSHIEALLRHDQPYSGIYSTLCNPCNLQPCHTSSPSIFRKRSIFKTLWKFEQVYSEPCHSQNSLFRRYSAIFRTLYNAFICRNLACLESCNIQNPFITVSQHIFRKLSC